MKKLKNIAVAIASVIIFTNITHAQAVKANYSVSHEAPLAVKFLGNDGDYLTFRVTVLTPIPDNAFLAVNDKYEGIVYSSFFSPTFKVQKVKIEKRDDQVLDFKLVIGKKTYSKFVSVNTVLADEALAAKHELTKL